MPEPKPDLPSVLPHVELHAELKWDGVKAFWVMEIYQMVMTLTLHWLQIHNMETRERERRVELPLTEEDAWQRDTAIRQREFSQTGNSST